MDGDGGSCCLVEVVIDWLWSYGCCVELEGIEIFDFLEIWLLCFLYEKRFEFVCVDYNIL